MSEQITRAPIDVGTRVGKLTVVEPTALRKNGYVVWRCACDCGGEILLDTRALQRGAVRDCGCSLPRGVRRDLTGQRFGRLVCIEPLREKVDGRTVWRCRCDCGNECLAVGTQLTAGYKKSCGCLGKPSLKDYVGKRFGALVVEEYAGKEKGVHLWRCRCDCGQETVVRQSNLQSGHAQSCGCLQREVCRDNLKLVEGTSVTIIQNRMKRGIRSNTSGYNGVYRNKRIGKWSAQITFQGKTYYLGSYSDIQDAVKARKRGEEMYENFLEWYNREYLPEKQPEDET